MDDHDIYLVYNGARPLALDADAQHLGDDVVFCRSSQMFESPAHGEKFDIRGFYFGGPAGRGLDRYQANLSGDGIYVDLDQPNQGPARETQRARDPQGPLCVP